MNYYSTNKKSPSVSFKEALLNGLAPDGGLYMPERIGQASRTFISGLPYLSYKEIAYEVGKEFVCPDISKQQLQDIIEDAFNFSVPLIKIASSSDAILELFHGPTLSFKDFGARFMARAMSCFSQSLAGELVVLVATSGDTGSAVAHGFWDIEGIRVIVLYPSGKVSEIQEKQLTTMGGNITALEIQGTFDDCQKLVKNAFVDGDVRAKLQLTSANSINIGRLIPQSFYYFYGYGQLVSTCDVDNCDVVISVPCGNFGNLTAGLLAKRMGLPVKRFIAATNSNGVVPRYLGTGNYEPKASRKTLSNAMDVGNPSNFVRMLDVYQKRVSGIRKDIWGVSIDDEQTKETIHTIYEDADYIMDPHTAVAYAGLQKYKATKNYHGTAGIVFSTAHGAKFFDIVEPIIGCPVTIPRRLRHCLEKEKKSILLSKNYSDFKEYLTEL